MGLPSDDYPDQQVRNPVARPGPQMANRGHDSLGRMSNHLPIRQAYSAGNTPLIPGSNRSNFDPSGMQQLGLMAGYSPTASQYGIYVNADDYRNKFLNPIYSAVQGPEAFTVASQHDALLNELLLRGGAMGDKNPNSQQSIFQPMVGNSLSPHTALQTRPT
ncbi:hypothetical protein Ciccas_014581, partial [Cichlidogyrus casuarinus]